MLTSFVDNLRMAIINRSILARTGVLLDRLDLHLLLLGSLRQHFVAQLHLKVYFKSDQFAQVFNGILF